MEYGGGICQVSSTLHAAVLGAKLQIDERHEHGRRVWYIKKGLDATVDWGTKDLKFTNNRDEPIYIGCVVDDNDRVRIALFGKLREGDPGLTEKQP
jgi:vancomycin resistance protein YoaR